MKRTICVLLTTCLLAGCFCACGRSYGTRAYTDIFSAIDNFNENGGGWGKLVATATGPNEVTITGKVRGRGLYLYLDLDVDLGPVYPDSDVDLDAGLHVIWKARFIGKNKYTGISVQTSGSLWGGSIEFGEGAHISGSVKLDSAATISGGTIEGNVESGFERLTIAGGTIWGDVFCRSGFHFIDGIIKGDLVSEGSGTGFGYVTYVSYYPLDIAGGIIEGNIHCCNSDLNITGGTIKGIVTSEEKEVERFGIFIGVVGATVQSGGPGNARITGGTIQGDINYSGDITILGGAINGEIRGKSVRYSEDEPEPEPQEPVPPEIYHTVVSGDTLWDLARYYLGNGFRWVEIQAANEYVDPRKLQIGMTLKIPTY